ncbi:adaptive immune response [Desmophyllum pertusum]|uniref:Adaptive immune response n=1 Tax=Desmophyllum pertusum TaxID=174260 RepID=A0A9W9YDM8_9CNID|nr:adaptive immune response [Desmophyllum pertusum]
MACASRRTGEEISTTTSLFRLKTLEHDVYCDQPADATEFGLSSVVLTKFRKSKRSKLLWEGIVRNYWQSYNFRKRKMTPYKIFVRTAYLDLGIKHQYTEEFHPSQVRLKGAHNACKYFKTECKPSETCAPRRLSGHIWPAEYKCVCTHKGFQEIIGRGCVEIDECQKSPCPANSVCKNIPGTFQCTCLAGYTGKDCSEKTETTDGEVTPPLIKQHTNKRIAIPRKTPTKMIRRAVYSNEAPYKKLAVMSALMILFNGLGMFFYRSQKKKRAKKEKEDKENIHNKGLKNEKTIPSNQELKLNKSVPNNQELKDNKIIPTNEELKMSSETIPDNQEMENTAIPSTQVLEGSKTSPSNQELENSETIQSNKKLHNTETIPGNQAFENIEAIPGNQELQDSETIPGNEELQDSETIPGNKKLQFSETIPGNQELKNSETIPEIKNYRTVRQFLEIKDCRAVETKQSSVGGHKNYSMQ